MVFVFHHIILHIYGQGQSGIIPASFSSYHKTLHGHICVSLSHRSPEGERGISSTLCHLPPHGLLISLPLFETNWTKWKALDRAGDKDDELFQKQRTAQILGIFFSCPLYARWLRISTKEFSEIMKEKRRLIINKKLTMKKKKLTMSTWVLNVSFYKSS